MLGEQHSVNVFAEYFHSVYSKDNNFLPDFDKRSNVLLSNIEIDVVEVDRHLRTLLHKYSSGPDNIPNILLKKLHSSLALPLSLIFQQNINTGCLPKLWKCANIVPVYKGNGSKYCVENYRPINLTSNVCKVMESIIYDEIYNHCVTNNLITIRFTTWI